MQTLMTSCTNSNNIKMMVRFITIIMMIKDGLFRAINTILTFYFRKDTFINKVFYCSISRPSRCLPFFTNLKSFLSLFDSVRYFGFCKNFSPIELVINFASFFVMSITDFSKFITTIFAITMKAISLLNIFTEFRNRFDLFASRTTFCLNCISHFRFLNRRTWLEPFARPILVYGSFYFNN